MLSGKEVFHFDNQNRLLNGQVTSPVALQQYVLNYNSNGTIAEKSDAGVYSEYDPLHPDAVKKIEPLAGNISHATQELAFNLFNKVSRIKEDNIILTIKYGPDQQRQKTELSTILNGAVQTTKYFLSNYEKIIDGGHVYEINYISAPNGLSAMYVTTNGVGKMYYVYSDHLGSILKVTDHNGTTYEQNFDAWGRYRNPATWNYTGIPVNPVWMHRGYTSHEHLQEFVLINMNGRLYDPVVGAMLSPDSYMSKASITIACNRYSLCLNNSLSFIDPNLFHYNILPDSA